MAASASSSASAIRRFLHLLVHDYKGASSYTLRNIDTTPFFAAGGAACHQSPAAMRPCPLPRRAARFDCSRVAQFFPLGHGRGVVEKIVCVNIDRHTIIFDTRTAAVRAGPDLRSHKAIGSPWAEAGGRLFLLGTPHPYDDPPPHCVDFEALTYDCNREDWFWNVLPSPASTDSRFIHSFADARNGDEEVIRVSTSEGTFAFHPGRCSWRTEGYWWQLPFSGRAQYVADYGLWFGFSEKAMSDLCAADLTAVDGNKPACRHVWTDIDGLQDHVSPFSNYSYLSYLGCGRFCVTRFLSCWFNDEGVQQSVAVVTAVEATTAAGEIQMVRRGSKCYHIPSSADSYGYFGGAY
ncbi:hypothetical protein QOZ80_3BG0258070 [Eleusine coracana subsp. coracana]|nr:hypothetical protein QOZ80_3BG0258070 [Eleusine coracana subsp. coracana]